MSASVFVKLGTSIFSNDFYILVAAFLETFVLIYALSRAGKTSVKVQKKPVEETQDEKRKIVNSSDFIVAYNLFVTGISVFPLLGMFGTVSALLGLDLSVGDMTNIKNNFFIALTSTAWGIIFSIIFKLVHALTVDYFERKIKESSELESDCSQIFEKEQR